MTSLRTAAWALLVLAGALTAVLAPTILRHLPRPPVDELAADDPADAAHVGFAHLARPRVLLPLAVGLAGAAVIVALRASVPLAWLGLASAAVLAVMVDAHTRYLPLPLMRAAWGLGLAGAAVESLARGDARVVARGLLGAAVLGLLFGALWRVGAVAFGDVRLVLAIGGATATAGWSTLVWAVLLGTTAGALWGVTTRVLTRARAFPYGPGLLLGAYAALLVPR